MTYAELWRWLRDNAANLNAAADFFAKSPTGQYDVEAEIALRAVIELMRRDATIR